MSFYPEKISRKFYALSRAGKAERANAVGAGATFRCGTFVRFFLEIDAENREIKDVRYRSNACGYALAAAETLAEKICGRRLTDLHGLENEELRGELENELDEFPTERRHCAEICFEALHAALADFRARQIEEFTGEKALICTCFGVTEEEIENVIEKEAAATVGDVTRLCKAGGGCGSCRMLIQEMLDLRQYENF